MALMALSCAVWGLLLCVKALVLHMLRHENGGVNQHKTVMPSLSHQFGRFAYVRSTWPISVVKPSNGYFILYRLNTLNIIYTSTENTVFGFAASLGLLGKQSGEGQSSQIILSHLADYVRVEQTVRSMILTAEEYTWQILSMKRGG